jgi:hypothetical protein
MGPIITPTTNPNSYPITTIFQPNSNGDPESWLASKIECLKGALSEFPHFFVNGFPHNPGLSSNELFSNVSNCFPCGIGPARLL